MEDLLKQLTSISWWIGVFFVGILINIISVPLWRLVEKKIDLPPFYVPTGMIVKSLLRSICNSIIVC
jgi:hypothetical protein